MHEKRENRRCEPMLLMGAGLRGGFAIVLKKCHKNKKEVFFKKYGKHLFF